MSGGPVADYICELPVDMYYEGSSAVRVVCRRPIFTLNCDQANAGVGGRSLSCKQFDAANATVRIISVRMEGFRVYNAMQSSTHGSLVRNWNAVLGTISIVTSKGIDLGKTILLGVGSGWRTMQTWWKE